MHHEEEHEVVSRRKEREHKKLDCTYIDAFVTLEDCACWPSLNINKREDLSNSGYCAAVKTN